MSTSLANLHVLQIYYNSSKATSGNSSPSYQYYWNKNIRQEHFLTTAADSKVGKTVIIQMYHNGNIWSVDFFCVAVCWKIEGNNKAYLTYIKNVSKYTQKYWDKTEFSPAEDMTLY